MVGVSGVTTSVRGWVCPSRSGSAGDGDPARLVLLGPLQAQPQHPVLELRLDPVRVDPERQLDRAAEGTAPALPAVVGLRLLRRGAAGAGDRERVPAGVDLEVARLDP